MDAEKIKLEPGWKNALLPEFSKSYMQELRQFLNTETKKHTVYPKPAEFFNAFNTTPLDDVKVVILGQDPYHGPNQAHGLCFSVQPGVDVPPSLVNIYKELVTDIPGFERPKHGNLLKWAEQGVLLLNATLSVRAAQAGSHQNKGWEPFTDAAIQYLNEHRENIVFMLWGSYAQKKGAFIDKKKHLVLTAPHPSPLSAHRGFLGSKHFSKANAYLEKRGEKPIDWKLS